MITENFSMIFATSINGVIGKNNKLLWNLPNDLKRFKKLTENKIVVMGRKTFESLPNGPLLNRLNIILSNNKTFLDKDEKIKSTNTGVIKLSNIQSLFKLVHDFEMNPSIKNINTDEVFIIGGGKIYELFLPFVQKIYATFVDVNVDGDTKSPTLEKYKWYEISEEQHKKDDKHEYDYTFLTLKKK